MNIPDRDYYFNLWLRFEEAGGTDKNTMIQLPDYSIIKPLQ